MSLKKMMYIKYVALKIYESLIGIYWETDMRERERDG